jgi:thiopurine S-methyltransferase
MEKNYWLNRWETGNIRFNQTTPHRFLIKYFKDLDLRAREKVFVPLCGKSVDMTWLLQQNQQVIGVEISPIAISDFPQENNLDATSQQDEFFQIYLNASCMLYQGDLFNLTSRQLADIKAIYDRGCITALPPKTLRNQYIDWLKNIISSKSQILLVVFEHGAPKIVEPPFSTTCEEVHSHFKSHFSIDQLERESIAEIQPHWAARGVCDLYECAYLLKKYK